MVRRSWDVDGGARVKRGEGGGPDGAGDELVGGPVADPGEVARLAPVRHLHVRPVNLLLKKNSNGSNGFKKCLWCQMFQIITNDQNCNIIISSILEFSGN